MKKNMVRIIAVALVVCMLSVMLVSCGTALSGTYSGEAGFFGLVGGTATYDFSGKKVTLTVTTEVLGFSKTSDPIEGEYSINEKEDGSKTITFTFGEDGGDKYNGTFAFAKGDGFIEISGVKFYKK